jgi:hypothetical protein
MERIVQEQRTIYEKTCTNLNKNRVMMQNLVVAVLAMSLVIIALFAREDRAESQKAKRETAKR